MRKSLLRSKFSDDISGRAEVIPCVGASSNTCPSLNVKNNCEVLNMISLTISAYLNGSDCLHKSLTLREDRRLRVFENKILRRIFGTKRDENGECRRLHNESLYCSPNIIRVIKSRKLIWAGHIARIEAGRSAFKILTSTSTGKRNLGRLIIE